MNHKTQTPPLLQKQNHTHHCKITDLYCDTVKKNLKTPETPLSLTHKGYRPNVFLGKKLLLQLLPAQGSTVQESKSIQISNRVRGINQSQVQGEST